MPDTIPAFDTVAIKLLLLNQVPPVVGVTVAELPTHTSFEPPKVGLALTVNVFVAEHPVAVSVKVKVTVPVVILFTRPPFVTVATAGLLLDHVPPVVGVTVTELPKQTSLGPPKIGLAGNPAITTF
jgi:hypothetical protein